MSVLNTYHNASSYGSNMYAPLKSTPSILAIKGLAPASVNNHVHQQCEYICIYDHTSIPAYSLRRQACGKYSPLFRQKDTEDNLFLNFLINPRHPNAKNSLF